MNQLVTPDYNIPYAGGLCEGFVEGTVGQATLPARDKNGNWQTYGPFPTAIAKWEAGLGNHPGEQPPSGVRVPLYFTLGSTPDGHTALQLEDGRVASSTQPGYHTTAYIHPSLEDLIDMYAEYNNGCTYLGWSEYIGKLRVIEGEDMPGNADSYTVQALSEAILGRTAEGDKNLENNIGRPVNDVIDTIRTYPEAKARAARADAPSNFKPYDGPKLFTEGKS